jgi:hypothetical protein
MRWGFERAPVPHVRPLDGAALHLPRHSRVSESCAADVAAVRALWTTPARRLRELSGGGSRNARWALRLLLRCTALAIHAHCRPHARRNGADLLLQQRLEVQQRLVALQHSQSVGLVPRSAVAAMRRS